MHYFEGKIKFRLRIGIENGLGSLPLKEKSEICLKYSVQEYRQYITDSWI